MLKRSNIKIQRSELMSLCPFFDSMPPLILAFDGSSRAKSRRLQREYREHGAEPPKSLSMQPFAGQSAVASVGEIAVLPYPKFRMLQLIRRTVRSDQLP